MEPQNEDLDISDRLVEVKDAYEQPISELLHISVSKRVLVHNHSSGN